ncbi:hypothetical protein EES45_34975 [Streptomyces sp. ADI97-07]|uniref:hypothetical protein n=1 Tax=Streptomyces sp. ADI97-07 TaxID=1522762 RepID=UPI000F5577BD|nr:hypothetical protein [Streptomyces sp. ADI97-07]RPK71189.1 hypothetical protein EES45_34975 [Streptomyces sp. ADI97-07]
MHLLALRRRVSVVAVTALLAGAGTLAAAPPALAGDDSTIFGKDNTVTVGEATYFPATTQNRDGITAYVTYSCDPAPTLYLGIAWRLADERDSQINSPRGVATVQPSQLTCDGQKHTVAITARTLLGNHLPFGEGDPVKVTASVSNFEGAPYAQRVVVTTL